MLLVFHDSDASYSPIIAFCLLVFNSGDAFKILLVKLSSPRFFLGMTRNLGSTKYVTFSYGYSTSVGATWTLLPTKYPVKTPLRGIVGIPSENNMIRFLKKNNMIRTLKKNKRKITYRLCHRRVSCVFGNF